MGYELEVKDKNIKDSYKKGETEKLPNFKTRVVYCQGTTKYLFGFNEYDVVVLLIPPIDAPSYYLYCNISKDSTENRYFISTVNCYAVWNIGEEQLLYTYKIENTKSSDGEWNVKVTLNDQYEYYYKKIETESFGSWYKIEFTQLPDYEGKLDVVVGAVVFDDNRALSKHLKTITIYDKYVKEVTCTYADTNKKYKKSEFFWFKIYAYNMEGKLDPSCINISHVIATIDTIQYETEKKSDHWYVKIHLNNCKGNVGFQVQVSSIDGQIFVVPEQPVYITVLDPSDVNVSLEIPDSYKKERYSWKYDKFAFYVKAFDNNTQLSVNDYQIKSVNVYGYKNGSKTKLNQSSYGYNYTITSHNSYYKVYFDQLPKFNGLVGFTVNLKAYGEDAGEKPSQPPWWINVSKYVYDLLKLKVELKPPHGYSEDKIYKWDTDFYFDVYVYDAYNNKISTNDYQILEVITFNESLGRVLIDGFSYDTVKYSDHYRVKFKIPHYEGLLGFVVKLKLEGRDVGYHPRDEEGNYKPLWVHVSKYSIDISKLDIEWQFPEDYDKDKIYSYKFYKFWFKLKVKYNNQVWSPNSYSIQINVTDAWGQTIDTSKYQVKITKEGNWYKVEFEKLPEIKGSIHITVNIIKGGEDLGEWPKNKETGLVEPIVLNLIDYTYGVSRCYITTDREYYPYASAEPVNIRVKVFGFKDNQSDIPLDNCTIEDNWPKTEEYIQTGPGEYEAFLPINHLPPGMYHIYVKVNPGPEGKSNVSENYVEYTLRYYNSNKNQTFKMPHPLFEDLHVYVNGIEIPAKAYTTALNDYGECILKIKRDQYQLKTGDVVKLKYKPYLTTVSFYVGNPFSISYEAVDDEAYKKYGIDTYVKIYVPFLQSVEEAKKIAETYLQYLSKPSIIITTNNKWDGD